MALHIAAARDHSRNRMRSTIVYIVTHSGNVAMACGALRNNRNQQHGVHQPRPRQRRGDAELVRRAGAALENQA